MTTDRNEEWVRHLKEREAELADLIMRLVKKTMNEVADVFERQNQVITAAAVDDLGLILTIWSKNSGSISAVYEDLLSEGVSHAAKDMGVYDFAISAVKNKTAIGAISVADSRLVNVSDALWQDARVSLSSGMDDGDSIPELADRIRAIPETYAGRATTIARTEVIGITNGGSLAYTKSLTDAGTGPAGKEWIAATDERTRPSHAEADGQKIAINASFKVGGHSADYPGDPSLPPEEVINCRCTIGWVEDAKDLDDPSTAPISGDAKKLNEDFAKADAEGSKHDGLEKLGQPSDWGETDPWGGETSRWASQGDGSWLSPDGYKYWPSEGGQTSAEDWQYLAWDESIEGFIENSRDIDALTWYTGDGYLDLNDMLRQGGSDVVLKSKVKRMTRAFDQAGVTPDSVIVKRGFSSDALEELLRKGVAKGETITDLGYMSTSLTNADYGNIEMIMKVPEGANAIPVEPITKVKGELELLVNRGSSFRVDKATQIGPHRWRIFTTLIQAAL